MQSGQFARQVKTNAVAGCGRGCRTVMEPFEDVFAWRNGGTSVADFEYDVTAVAKRANPNSPPEAIVFSRVLQKVLDDKRHVAFLAGHKKTRWKFLFNLHIG